ncbi:MAG: type IX secretion system membrane protein PorP/SprF [Bacteroidetes bacterium]|nr:type IX secretion system membrane protein PorP/SprF [Bacteroidota bacterium]
MKKILTITFILLLPVIVFSQQDAHFTQYMFNTISVNPGYTGTRDALSLLALHRSQWVGFPGAPVTQTINVNSPLFNRRLGMGISVVNDKIGPVNQTGIFTDLAYRIKFQKSNLSLGIKGGADLYKNRLSDLALVSVSDDQFRNDVTSRLLPNFGFGAYYYSDKWYLGISTPKMIRNTVDVTTGNAGTAHLSVQKMHWFVLGGLVADITPFIRFKPSMQLKVTGGAPVSADVTANFLFYDRLWLGAMYRNSDAIGLLVQFHFTRQLRAGYSYDYTISKLSAYNSGTHEVMIGYDFSFAKEKIKSPRFF